MSNFGAYAQTVLNQIPKKQFAPKVIEKFWLDLNLGETPKPILFLKGDYNCLVREETGHINTRVLPWKNYIAHKPQTLVNGMRKWPEVPCPNLDSHNKQNCVGCFYLDHGDSTYKVKSFNAFNVIVFSYYHDVPYIKDGKPLVKNGQPIFNSLECTNRGVQQKCEHCKTFGPPTRYGTHLKLTVGSGHFQNIIDMDALARQTCSNCSTHIAAVSYKCDKCSNILLDLRESVITDEQRVHFESSTAICPACNQETLPQEVLECGYDEQWVKDSDPCDNPQRLGLFECVWMLKKTGEGKSSTISQDSFKSLKKFKPLNKQPVEQVIADAIAFAKDDKRADGLYDFDLDKAPKTPDEQAMKLGVKNPLDQATPPMTAYPNSLNIPQVPYGTAGVQAGLYQVNLPQGLFPNQQKR